MEEAVFLSIILLLGIADGALAQKGQEREVFQYVNTFVSTGGEGFGIGSDPPGAQAPFGMVRLSPDTINWEDVFIPWNHFGGYYHGDTYVRLFTHTHMVGSGITEYGNVGFIPATSTPTSSSVKNYGYRARFSHDRESSHPGYYAVLLEDLNVQVELTATPHVGVHRYTFQNHKSGADDMFVYMDPTHSLSSDTACRNASITIDKAAMEIYGWTTIAADLSSRFGGMTIYFSAKFSNQFQSVGVWSGTTVSPSTTTITGSKIGAFVSLQDEDSPIIEFKVGISFISIDQARTNWKSEVGSGSFADVLTHTSNIWENYLNSVQIEGGTIDDRTKFYTALYHTLMAPTNFSEAGGVYFGFDKQPHKIDEGSDAYYTDMSIWDVHRSEFPWLLFLQPTIMRDIVRSLINMYKQGGDLPRWPFANGYTNCMIGQHADIIIADAYFKGITDFDIQSAYKAMKEAATTPRQHAGRADLKDWLSKGYVAYDVSEKGCSETLEYAYDDWAIGNIARALNFTEDSEMFLNRSLNFRNVWNNEQKFFCPRLSSGDWSCPWLFNDAWDGRYVEGDGWHWRWFVPHNVPELIKLFGSEKYFVEQLTEFFDRSEEFPFNVVPNPYYWAGNEPDIFAVWMFDYAGRPDLTQKYSRWLLDNKFTTSPDGLPGNDDYGTMSAWFIFASLGFYPLSGSTTYLMGSPLFDKVTIHRGDGTTTTIIAHDNSHENVYVQKVAVNGKVLSAPFIEHSQLSNSVIEFWMTSTPSKL